MATLYIAEYSTMPTLPSGQPQIAAEPSIADQTVTISGTSAQSAAFSVQTNYIGVTCDGIWSRKIGKSPTATAAGFRIPADAILYFAVQPGDKIAGVTNT